jgi:hypothetical protein
MKKEIIIGLSVLAVGGAIMGGVIVSRNQDNPFNIEEQKENADADNSQKIEKLWIDELKDKNKFGFCLAEADINTNYTDSILDAMGIVEYTSKEVLLYNKETEKLYIMSRQADYKYNGRIKMSLGGIAIDEPVKENGKIDETYDRNEMPIRIDYANKYIFSDPSTKENTWVYSNIGEETDMVMPHHGCAGKYQLDNTMGKDILVGGEQIQIDRECKESGVNGTYDGDFTFKCSAIDYDQAMEVLGLAKTRQELQETKDTSVMNNEQVISEEKKDASASAKDAVQGENTKNELRDAIESSKEVAPDNEMLKKQLEQMQSGIQADQTAR